MGSGASRLLLPCLRPSAVGGGPGCGGGGNDRRSAFDDNEDLGHSFCYVRSSAAHSRSSSLSDLTAAASAAATFKSISGASVSANSNAPLPVSTTTAAPGFRSSASFSSIPLQLSTSSFDRGFFLSGPIERGALSGPLDSTTIPIPIPYSGPLAKRPRRRLRASILRRSFSERNRPSVVPLRSIPNRCDCADLPSSAGGSVQWAQGKAGEDRVHIVVSEEHHWLFIGIYDGFNGPDAPEFLVGNLYRNVFDELRGLFWEEAGDDDHDDDSATGDEEITRVSRRLWEYLKEIEEEERLELAESGRIVFSLSKLRNGLGSLRKEGNWNWFPRWRYHSDDKVEVAREAVERVGCRRRKAGLVTDHELVLRALTRALDVTELAYLEMTDRAMGCNPELALTGSCLLVVLMRDDHVYVMNVGDSRAIVAQSRLSHEMLDETRNGGGEFEVGRGVQEIGEGVETELPACAAMELGAVQLSTDHSTRIEEEVLRIKEEHPDDNQCIVNNRVKGRLNVTRAFGAGFLKQPKWNNELLEVFRNEYIGTAPYISCLPSLCHHKLGPNDQFLVLSSDGLYQYLSNEEVVLHVESFLERFPDGDPAQSLIEELLSRAAKKAGLDFHELLDIPQGDRRKYHDDVTVMVISLEGRIWKSSG